NVHENVDTPTPELYAGKETTFTHLDPVPTFASAATDTETHCPYCAFQCGIRLSAADDGVVVAGNEAFPVNKGALCIKGFTSSETLDHPDRLRTPLVRTTNGTLVAASWDEALDRIAAGIRAAQERY